VMKHLQKRAEVESVSICVEGALRRVHDKA
jgi:hypothetical protein